MECVCGVCMSVCVGVCIVGCVEGVSVYVWGVLVWVRREDVHYEVKWTKLG